MELLSMDTFTMEIAGVVFSVRPMFEFTREYCRGYLSEKMPEFFLEVFPEDLVHEQMLLDKEAREEGLKLRKFPESFLERSAIQRRVADHLLSKNTLMLHGSTVAVDGIAYLFTAPCGTGKSTHTRLWRELFGQRAVMVNDDKPFLRIADQGVLAYGSPWTGKHGLGSNVCVPLGGICLLKRGTENWIQAAEREELLEVLRQQVHIPEDDELREAVFPLLDKLIERVPLWEMECNKELEAARVAFDAMAADLTNG